MCVCARSRHTTRLTRVSRTPWKNAHNPYMHRSVCDLEMVGWLVPVTQYTGLAEWLPTWNWNGDVHRDTEPYLHWNAFCESHWVSRSMTNPTIQKLIRVFLIQETRPYLLLLFLIYLFFLFIYTIYIYINQS